MTPKEKRDRLFKSGRPFIRPMRIVDGDSYHPDVSFLWLAYKRRPFIWMDGGMGQQDFAERLKDYDLLVIDDRNSKFKSGSGIVTVICELTDGWKLEPHAEHMPWASTRNQLRSTVAYLQYVRYSKKVGACIVYALDRYEKFYNTCCEYGVLHRVGTIVNGDPKGDVVVYSVRGKKHGISISGTRSKETEDKPKFNLGNQAVL